MLRECSEEVIHRWPLALDSANDDAIVSPRLTVAVLTRVHVGYARTRCPTYHVGFPILREPHPRHVRDHDVVAELISGTGDAGHPLRDWKVDRLALFIVALHQVLAWQNL